MPQSICATNFPGPLCSKTLPETRAHLALVLVEASDPTHRAVAINAKLRAPLRPASYRRAFP
jgi:hypothetical protein